ncbi:hypothetical protein GA0070616_2278 [Micromonospora nigra]|uniref:Uncharacterized protein n=1 Tax=Micromonospora nigra TaxID=145857 RepID=A0A1C6RVX9_9ACTN|nr:hypothetical protein [Micromonospora nigra]SCL21356.1 hypothetical protein GA0070616_2278 [Micromonospora nigra]
MAISSCTQCGKGFRSVSVDDTGTLAICTAGHYTFDPTTASSGGTVTTGRVTVTGQCAIGNGATAIGSTGGTDRKKRR